METLLVPSSLEVSAEQTKDVAMPREENAGQNHNIQICNKFSETM
jgi:hypothetical protein